MFTNVISNPTKRGLPHNYAEYLCDTVSDIKSLPTNKSKKMNGVTCAIGSKALVVSTKDLYILDNSSKWVLLKNVATSDTSSGVGGGTSIVNEIASVSEVASYLNI